MTYVETAANISILLAFVKSDRIAAKTAVIPIMMYILLMSSFSKYRAKTARTGRIEAMVVVKALPTLVYHSSEYWMRPDSGSMIPFLRCLWPQQL